LIERAATEGETQVFASQQVWTGGGVAVESLQAAARMLRTRSSPYLDWMVKAERHQIDPPTVPLFVHERNSTKAILDGVKHRVARGTTLHESVRDHLAGTISEPFPAGGHKRIAVKVIDERGNELMVVKTIGKE
jgi:hypothetical protein